jgi:uncharacterized repeat protein (TIGR01451 family)
MKMKFTHVILATAIFGAVSLPGAAFSQTAPVTLQSDIKIEKTIIQDGVSKVVYVPATRATPGKRLIIGNTYRNNSAAPINNFAITNPLPSGVSYQSDPTDRGQLSVDGGQTWGQLAALTVANADGTRRPAQAGDVTHIRWNVPVIAPGTSGTVAYHAVVR